MPPEIDKHAGNRTLYLGEEFIKHSGHLHLNMAMEWKGEIYALFHAFGAVVNLSQDRVMFRHPSLKGAHNLLILDDGTTIVNNAYKRYNSMI